jgi:glucoamylase
MLFRRGAAVVAAVVVVLAGLGVPRALAQAPASAPGAPGAPGAKSDWRAADKTGFGTARSTSSRVWYTLQGGALSEVFYPDLSTPSVRSLELVVSDGRTFTDRESTDTRHVTRLTDPRSLTYQQVNTARSGRYRITKTYVTDPARSTVLTDIAFSSLDGRPYQVYALYDPSLGNGGMEDTGSTDGGMLVARDGRTVSALAAAPGLKARSNGFLGASDGWTDLRDDHRMDWKYASARRGNVVQTARLALTGVGAERHVTLALGFGDSPGGARGAARASLARGFAATARAYASGWHRYLDGLRPPPASAARIAPTYTSSVMVLAASEDKAHRGAFVASPSMPWAWGKEIKDLSSPSGAYHLVWSRDLYQIATALLAAGDRAAAVRAVDYLFRTQQKSDGSFPQNSRVDGTPVWTGLQLDEVALPIVLAWQLGRHDRETYASVRKAAGFLVGYRDPKSGRAAPYSPQERWENASGYSPATIAAAVAGLVCAADLARRAGDAASARRWLATADAWQRRVEDWTVTTNGPYSTKPYYLRLTVDGKPDRGTTYGISDGGPAAVDQRRVVDAGFLELVRLGVKAALDPAVTSSLPVVDRRLAVDTPTGRFWRRFDQDGYGETRNGGMWRVTDPGSAQTLGRAWPILAGERGEYELAAGHTADSYLTAMAATAGSSRLIAEQVWDGRPPASNAGRGTYSATPLIWSHAQLVRLAWSIDAGKPIERPAIVYCRYATSC